MHYALPAACGQTRHFNYCALVDGDVRREAAHTDPFYSPHLWAESETSRRGCCRFRNQARSAHLQRLLNPFCVPVRTTLRGDTQPGRDVAAGCHHFCAAAAMLQRPGLTLTNTFQFTLERK